MSKPNDFDIMLGDVTYDSVTGQDSHETVESRQDLVKAQAVEEGHKLESLSKHPGWKLIKGMMEETIEREKFSLLHANNLDFLRITQALIKARMDLLGWIDIKVAESKGLLEEGQ